MPERCRIELVPLGETVEVDRGTPLDGLLFRYGVEFPCGGAGQCRGCRVRVLKGSLSITPEMEEIFSAEELAAGWRLGCQAVAEGPLTLEIAQWEMSILSDDTQVPFEPGEGLAIAIDIGTTTLVAQLLDLSTGDIAGVRTALNPQTAHGADVMSRVQFALRRPDLTPLIRQGAGALVAELAAGHGGVREVVLVGNTVMHHLFCGLDVESLSHVPFETPRLDEQRFRPRELGWNLPGDCLIRFLPCVGGFVGSDVLAGVLAAGLAESDALQVLVDLGTNGEIVLGNRHRLVCASTAAGPAFEAGRISMGMRAASGAIAHVSIRDGALRCRVVDDVLPRGICGSGLVDAAACALDLGLVQPSGRLQDGVLHLAQPVSLNQRDIRELQLAKAAIAAGSRILLERWGADADEVQRLHLAGAFGNYVNVASARRIGLLELPRQKIHPAGNTALRGAKMVLLSPRRYGGLLMDALRRTEHIPLGADPRFQEVFVDSMPFPAAT